MEVDWDGVDLLDNTLEPSGTMHFVLQTPLLQRIALVKIMAHLWTLREIFTQITRLPGYAITQGTREWTALEWKVNNKVGALPLPKQCKQQLRNLVEPLGIEIIRFCHYHCKDNIRFQFLENVLPQRLRWTMHGPIDYKKTAELLVKEEILDVERRYELACINCLEDQARKLLQSMGQDQRREYVNRVRHTRRVFDHHYLIVYFTCTLIGDVAHLHNYFQALMSEERLSFQCCLFMEMTWRGNRATCEHLFGKLDQGEKEQVFERCALVITRHRQASSAGSLLYYLSMMNEEQQESMFRECIVQLLLCLLRWPLQSLVVQVAECVFQTMNNDKCTRVLRAIVLKISQDVQDYDYVQLFCECWRLCRINYKRRYRRDGRLLGELVGARLLELTELVMNDGSSGI